MKNATPSDWNGAFYSNLIKFESNLILNLIQ